MNYLETHLKIVKHLIEHTFKHNYKRKTIEDVLWDVVSNCVKFLDFEDCVIYLLDKEKNRLVQKAAYGVKGLDASINNPIDIKFGEGIVGAVAQSKKSEIINDCSKDPRYIVDDASRLSEISVPLLLEGELIGVIDSEHSQKHFFKPEHLDILESIASICAIKMAEMMASQENEVLARFFNEAAHPTMRLDSTGQVLNSNRAAEPVLQRWHLSGGKIHDEKILDLIQNTVRTDANRTLEITLGNETFNLSFHPISGRRYVNVYSSNVTALKNAKMEAENANRVKDKFLSVISHEIRTPLNAIIGTLNLLKSEAPTEQQLEYLRTTDYASNKLLTLLNNVLDVEKIEANKMELETVHFNLRTLFNNLKNAFIFETQSRNNDLEFIIDSNVGQNFRGDETRLFQILINLLNNAVKFTENGKITFRVIKEASQAGKCRLRFEVIDTGIGIPSDKLNSIFNPFQQAEDSITRRFGGTGLGLSIAKNLVVLLGGSLNVNSTEGEGTTFTVILDLECSVEDVVKDNSLFEFDVHILKNIKILLVDDNIVNLKIGEQFLKKWGATIVKAENGNQAFDAFKNQDVDLILMDIHMPECNGYEATKKIRASKKTNRHLPIVAITADATKHSRYLAAQAGIDDVISKPYTPEEFIAKIEVNLAKQVNT